MDSLRNARRCRDAMPKGARLNRLFPRGFDTFDLEQDRIKSLEQLSVAAVKGYKPPTPWESVVMAMLLAEVFIETSNALASQSDVFGIIREKLPDEWALAEDLTEIVRSEPRDSADSAKRCIDKALVVCFAFAGEHLDLEKDLIDRPPAISWRDKWPGWLRELTPQQKCEVGKAMARSGLGGMAKVQLLNSMNGAGVQFSSDGVLWTEPVPLPFRLPDPTRPHEAASRIMEINEKNRSRQMEQFERTKNHTPGRRTYATGEARFITQVRMEQMLAGEHPYAYAFNNPVTYVDPSGNAPTGTSKSPTYSPCGKCASAILASWYGSPAHTQDHGYAHCMACCVLSQLAGDDCALSNQFLQNLRGGIEVGSTQTQIMQNRYNGCLDGLGIVVRPPESSFGACQRGCQSYYPLPGGVKPFPNLPECDPTNYEKRPAPPSWMWPQPAPSWNYCSGR